MYTYTEKNKKGIAKQVKCTQDSATLHHKHYLNLKLPNNYLL